MNIKRFFIVVSVLVLLLSISTFTSESTVSAAGTPAGSKQTASLSVTSDPSEAPIFIDGKDTGHKTPYTFHNLSVGGHAVLAKKPPLYDSDSRTIDLTPGENSVGLSISETWWYYMLRILPNLLLGLLMTLFLTIVSVFDGIIIGTVAGVARVIHNKFVNFIAGLYVNFIRGTPLLVQIFMLHFGTPQILGTLFNHGEAIPLNPFASALIALSINSGAYIAEIVRAGIQSIDPGQMEAARSLGMTYRQAMRFVILPQALKRVIPPLGNEFIAMLKDSSLVSVIGMEELVRTAQIAVTRSYRATETWLEVGLLFLAMTIPFTILVSRLEKRLKTSD